MPAAKLKISSTDVQLYLLGELEGEKADYIAGIDSRLSQNFKSKMDREIKSTLLKIRSVDNMLQSAADRSYEMPASLENKINSIIASKEVYEKKTPQNLFEKLGLLLSKINNWSFGGGAVAASLGMLAIIQIQPGLLIDMHGMKSGEIIMRGAVHAEDSISKCGDVTDGSWIVTQQLIIKMAVCSNEMSRKNLVDGDTVSVGDQFEMFIVPLKNGQISVEYISEAGEQTNMLDQETVFKGKPIKLPREGEYYFSEPKGKDTIRFSSTDGYSHDLKINVN